MSIRSALERVAREYQAEAAWVDDKDGSSEFEITAYNGDTIAGRMEHDWNGRVVEINLTYTPRADDAEA